VGTWGIWSSSDVAVRGRAAVKLDRTETRNNIGSRDRDVGEFGHGVSLVTGP
jgi:hypothetical protein